MRPKKPLTLLAVTCCTLFVGGGVVHGQSDTAVADAAVSIAFQNSGGATVGRGVSISFQSGGIIVTTNLLAATFIITGPATFAGSGTSASFPNAPPGTYTIAFGDLAGYVTPQAPPQTLVIGGTITFSGTYISYLPSLGASPAALTFTYQQGTAPPSPQTLTVSSTDMPLNFTAAASTTPSSGTWLSVSPTSGTTGGPSGTLAVSVAGGLTAATYNGQITLTAAGASNSPLPVPVTLNVTPSTQPLSLIFPIQAQCHGAPCTPYTAPIAAVFDHLMTAAYSKGNSIQAYTGDTGARSNGPGTLTATPSTGQVALSWTPTLGATLYKISYATGSSIPSQSKLCSVNTIYSGTETEFLHTGLTNGTKYNYMLCVTDGAGDVNAGLNVSATPTAGGGPPITSIDLCLTYRQSTGAAFNFGIYGNFRGAKVCGSADYLAYAGHPGYDYVYPYGQPIYAATAGSLSFTDASGYSQPQMYHVLTLTPSSGRRYKVLHLHLSSYYCAAQASPDCPSLPNVVYPAVIQRLLAGTYQACVGPDKVTPCPSQNATVKQGDFIGYVGDYEQSKPGAKGWEGVSPHLHFEIRWQGAKQTYWPVDPYQWLGSGPDPYHLGGTTNVLLWQVLTP